MTFQNPNSLDLAALSRWPFPVSGGFRISQNPQGSRIKSAVGDYSEGWQRLLPVGVEPPLSGSFQILKRGMPKRFPHGKFFKKP